MIPVRFNGVEKLPLTANGKVDKKALPASFETFGSWQKYLL